MQRLQGNCDFNNHYRINVLKTENDYCFIEILKNESSNVCISHLIIPTLQSFSDLEIERKHTLLVYYNGIRYFLKLPQNATNAFLYFLVDNVFQQFGIISDFDILTLSENQKDILNNNDELYPFQMVNVSIESGQLNNNNSKDIKSVMEFDHLSIQFFILYRSIACNLLIMRLGMLY